MATLLLMAIRATLKNAFIEVLFTVELAVSQDALGVDADLDRSYMGGIERGEHNLTVMNVVKIAGALKTSPSAMLGSAGL